MYVIYALISQRKDWIYVGFSSDLEDRLKRHHSGGYEKTTAPYRPFTVIQLAITFNRTEARKPEKWYKTSYRKKTMRLYVHEKKVKTPPFHGGITNLPARLQVDFPDGRQVRVPYVVQSFSEN